MRPAARLAAAFVAVLGAGCAASLAGPAHAESLSVPLDQVQRVQLRGSAADVVIGNPEIADVAMIDPHTLVITGKGPGTTSLLVLDGAHRVLFDGPVSVSSRAGHVAMVRGAEGGPAEERVFTCYGVCTPSRGR